jgi:hypothetical protein
VAVAWIKQLLTEAKKSVDEAEVFFVKASGQSIREESGPRARMTPDNGGNAFLPQLPVENYQRHRNGTACHNRHTCKNPRSHLMHRFALNQIL